VGVATWLDLADLAGGPGTALALDASTATGTAAVLVDVTTGRAALEWEAVRATLHTMVAVTIAVGSGPLAEAFDVAVEDADAASQVVDGIERAPIAATTYALLLRRAPSTVAEGLVAESAAYSTLQAGPEFAAWRAGRPPRERPPVDAPAVLVERDGGVLHLTLNRPERHNAFSVEVRDALYDGCLLAVVDDTIERVVLDGAGPSFCSGGDLDEFGQRPDPAQAHLVRLARSVGRLVTLLTDRFEVHLHGACMGAGIEVPAFAGRVVARPDAVIALPEVPLGLLPGAGGTVSLPRRIGRQRTAWLGLTGARITASEALRWGLVDAIDEGDGREIVPGA
jgi:enoyl-CoA hydratase/carnithine racemase